MKNPFSIFTGHARAKTSSSMMQDPAAATHAETLLDDDSQDKFQSDLQMVEEDEGAARVHAEAEQKIRDAAKLSLKRLHVLQQGRCPQCGAALDHHMFFSICDSCGWSSYSMPRRANGVKVHTVHTTDIINGDRCYVVEGGVVLITRGDAVVARVPARSVEWIEYDWQEGELAERRKLIHEKLSLTCGWCGKETTSEKDGFHLVQAAFGSTQERYVFCSDECYEAFRQMYPSRVHRNCYERSCENCDLCLKRYSDESEGLRTLAKDLITVKKLS